VRALPPLVKGAVQRAQDGTLRLQVDTPGVESLKATIRESNRRRDAVTVGSVILLGGLVWLGVGHNPEWPGYAPLATGVTWLVAAWRR
jgi:ferric-dicitrate binding protein FerR (iron transport regulator)